jgi:hypothetical protein
MMGIRIPFLGIHALDDPVVCEEALPKMEVQATPYGVLCTTDLGGHLGWFELGGGRWFAKAVSFNQGGFVARSLTEIDRPRHFLKPWPTMSISTNALDMKPAHTSGRSPESHASR